MSATVDTLKLARRFRDAGMPEPQAEVFAEALRETQEGGLAQLATRRDIEDLGARLGLMNASFATKAELREEVLKLEHKLDTMEHRLTIKLGGMMVVAVGVVAAFVKLL